MPSIDEQLQKKKPFKKKTYRSYLSLDETLEDVGQPSTTNLNSRTENSRKESPEVHSKPTAENAPKVQNEPKVSFTPDIHNTPMAEYGHSLAVESNLHVNETSLNIQDFTPQIDNPPKGQNEPKVILTPMVNRVFNDDLVNPLNSIKNTDDQNAPEVTFVPDVQNEPKVIFTPKAQNTPETDLKVKTAIDDNSVCADTDVPIIQNTPKVVFAPNVHKAPKVNIEQTMAQFETQISNSDASQIFKAEKSKPKASTQTETTESANLFIHQHAAIENFNIHHPNMNKGFTRVPNSILQILMSGELSKNELQILSVVLRMTIGFNRESAPISLGVIQNLTGIQTSRISTALNTLIEKNLIKRKSGTINSPNLLSIVYSDEQSKIAISPRVENTPKVVFDSKVENPPQTLGEKSTLDLTCEKHLQYINNIHIETLSQGSVFLKDLIAPMMKKERERVLKLVDELKNESIEDIQLVFENVFNKKLDTFGAPIKSEIGYLETCFIKHRDWLKSQLKEKRDKLEHKFRSELLKQAEVEQSKAEDDDWNHIVLKFQEMFPTEDEQLSAINKYSEEMTGPYSNIFPARRSFAIKAWSEDQTF